MPSPRLSLPILGFLLAAVSVGTIFAEPQPISPAVQKLRDSLRNTMMQLRTSENDKAVLQATQAENEEKIKTLTEQAEKLSKQLIADKDASDKSIATLHGQIDERDKQIGGLKEGILKLEAEIKRVTDIANTKEAQRAKLEEQGIQLTRRVADQQTKNAGMFKIANEILVRYEKFGLGDALTAREPFTGITRVKLQSLFEEYQDKLVDQKITGAAKPTPGASVPPSLVQAEKHAGTPAPAGSKAP